MARNFEEPTGAWWGRTAPSGKEKVWIRIEIPLFRWNHAAIPPSVIKKMLAFPQLSPRGLSLSPQGHFRVCPQFTRAIQVASAGELGTESRLIA